MTRYHDVLGLLARGTPLSEIASELDMRTDAVRAMVESMVREDHVRDMGCHGDACAACPMADACGISEGGPNSYFVTEAGRALLDDPPDRELSVETA